MDVKRLAIIDASPAGIVLGALLARSGIPVDFIDSRPDTIEALSVNGAVVTGSLDLVVPVISYLPGSLNQVYDVVLLTCGQDSAQKALAMLKPCLSHWGTVCVLQPDIPSSAVAASLGRAHLVRGAVLFEAGLNAPGVARCISPTEYMVNNVLVALDSPTVGTAPYLLELQKLLSRAGRVVIAPALHRQNGSKTLCNILKEDFS